MTITSTTARVDYAGNGATTAFPVTFPFFGASEIEVWQRITATGAEVRLTRGVHFAVTGGDGATGTVTATTAPAAGIQWSIIRRTARSQATDYVENDTFPAAAHERALDRLTAIVQEIDVDLGRSMRVASTDPAPGRLPSSTLRAGRYLAFDLQGNPTAAALTTTSVPLVSGLLDLKAGGYIKADGVTDDTAGWIAAAATGLPLYYSGGNTVISGAVTLSAAGQVIIGHDERSIVTASGSFNTFQFTGDVRGQGIEGIRFNSAGKTGGYDVWCNGTFRFQYHNVRHYDTFQAIYIGRAQGSEFFDPFVSAYRGPRGVLLYGTDLEKCSIVSIHNYRTASSAGVGGPGLEIDGNVATISLYGIEGVGSTMTHCLHIRNTPAATLGPRFIFAYNVQSEFASSDGVRIDDGLIIDLEGGYCGIGEAGGLYIGPDAQRVTVKGFKLTGNETYGAYIAGLDVALTGCECSNNSLNAPNRGLHDGVHIAGSARRVTVTGGTIGAVGGAAASQRWGVYAAAGALNVAVVGASLVGNVRGPARDDTGGGAGNMDVIGCAGLQSSFEANTVIGSQAGFRAVLTPTVSGGAITAVTVADAGFHYDAAPSVIAYDPAGTGSGATFTAAVANGKISGVTVTAGGANYSAGTFLYVLPANGPGAIRSLNSGTVSAELRLRAQGTAAVTLGSENGVVFTATSVAGTVNGLQAVGSAAGGSFVELRALGADTDLDLRLLPKGSGLLRLEGATAATAGAVAGYLNVKIGATAYRIPYHALA